MTKPPRVVDPHLLIPFAEKYNVIYEYRKNEKEPFTFTDTDIGETWSRIDGASILSTMRNYLIAKIEGGPKYQRLIDANRKSKS